MENSYFVQLKLGNANFGPSHVSTKGCHFVEDFKNSIKAVFSKRLQEFETYEFSLFEAGGTTKICAMETTDILIGKKMPFSVVPEIAEDIVKISEISAISVSRHKDYKHSKAVHSCRTFLTSIASELDKIYPISGRNRTGKRYLTIGDIFDEAYKANPEPKPQFKNTHKRLNDLFTTDEWIVLEDLNNIVNPELHSVLHFLYDGHSKEIIVPLEVNQLASAYQSIAKKSNVVSNELHLIVKNEGSVSGGSPDSDKRF